MDARATPNATILGAVTLLSVFSGVRSIYAPAVSGPETLLIYTKLDELRSIRATINQLAVQSSVRFTFHVEDVFFHLKIRLKLNEIADNQYIKRFNRNLYENKFWNLLGVAQMFDLNFLWRQLSYYTT